MLKWLVVLVVAGCSGSKHGTPPNPPPPVDRGSAADLPDHGSAVAPVDSAVAPDLDDGITYTNPAGGSPGTVEAMTVYRSDCSTTHPIARDPCSGTPFDKRGLQSCKSQHVKVFKPCKKGEPSCYVETTCGDGRVVPSDFLECSSEQSGRCFTRSSRIYKEDIAYLSDNELADLATQIDQLKLARFRYKDTGTQHVGFIIEDEPNAAWVTADGRRVDLYSLVSASIATIQQQDARIRRLERDIETCKQR